MSKPDGTAPERPPELGGGAGQEASFLFCILFYLTFLPCLYCLLKNKRQILKHAQAPAHWKRVEIPGRRFLERLPGDAGVRITPWWGSCDPASPSWFTEGAEEGLSPGLHGLARAFATLDTEKLPGEL